MLRASLFALALLAGSAGAAIAQDPAPAAAQASQLDGRTVRGAGGAVLGVVERVIYGANGHPAQVLVRPKGPRPAGPRSLSFAGLTQTADGLSTPLTKAEFDAMPTVEIDAN
ncbi:MAG TPA: hypothetical protein VFW47_02720 [Phenylobacterium sp.]|nr:hypothetical protein [Phenylobacterium sp.]